MFGLGSRGIVLGLDNTKELLSSLGDPQDSFRTVHVAGTDGKGSACALLASVLSASGIRTGLYTSPHILKFNERISISGIQISDAELREYAERVKRSFDAMSKKGIECTFFEVTTAIAFLYFKEKEAEYVVAEVGMGGRYDATNVVMPEVSIINHIGLEHVEYLGDTVEKIAFEKAGIIKKGIPVVTNNTGAALKVIEDVASERSAPVFVPGKYEITDFDEKSVKINIGGCNLSVGMSGEFQASNASLVFEALRHLKCYDRLRGHIQEGFEKVDWPCRLQKIEGMPFIVDVSHTKDGSEASFASVKKLYGGVTVVFGLLSDKDADGICKNLASVADKAIVTVPPSERAMDAQHVAEVLKKYLNDVETIPEFGRAMDRAMEARGDRNVLVTGSFYMAEGALKWLKKTYAGY